MRLCTLNIANFKNIEQARLEMAPGLNCFVGDNGMGKSNLLDAIYYLSFCKSFTGAPDALMVRRGADFMAMQADYLRHGDMPDQLAVGLGGGHRKTVKRGGKEYERLSSHIGMFPAVLISPADTALVTSTDERRRYLDMALAQADPGYLDALVRYNHHLAERNRLLRDGTSEAALLEVVEGAMAACARRITEARTAQIERLQAIHRRYYQAIAGCEAAEEPALAYAPALDGQQSLTDALERARSRDALLRFTTVGPHRDDITLTANGLPLRRTASQGQQKTFTIALRMAQYEFVQQATGLRPLLLLDDIFDKLDAHRVAAIINVITATAPAAQVFITDTNPQRLAHAVSALANVSSAVWRVSNGTFTPMPRP